MYVCAGCRGKRGGEGGREGEKEREKVQMCVLMYVWVARHREPGTSLLSVENHATGGHQTYS